jgi:hypothetical protein
MWCHTTLIGGGELADGADKRGVVADARQPQYSSDRQQHANSQKRGCILPIESCPGAWPRFANATLRRGASSRRLGHLVQGAREHVACLGRGRWAADPPAGMEECRDHLGRRSIAPRGNGRLAGARVQRAGRRSSQIRPCHLGRGGALRGDGCCPR